MKALRKPLALAGFEWRYHTRQLAFWIAALLLFLLGAFVRGRLGAAANLNLNAPYLVDYGVSMLSLLSVFVCMVFCANAALRDTDHRMAELVYAAPLRKRDFLLARFGGAFAASLTATSMLAVGMFAATFLPLDPYQTLGPRLPWHYVHALLLIVAPNVLLVSAVLFAIATFSRSMVATYAGAMLLYALYWIGAALGGSPMLAQTSPPTEQGMALAAMLDPFAISAFLEQTMHWNAWEKNTQLVVLDGRMLINRAVCIGLAMAILALVAWRFRFKLATPKGGSTKEAPTAPAPAVRYRPVTPSSRRTQWRAFLAQLWLEIAVVIKGYPFIAMLLIWSVMVATEMYSGLSNADAGSRVLPYTALLISRFQFDMLPLFGTLLAIFYSGELVWRERALRIDALVDGTPVSGTVFFAAKWVALACLPMMMIAAAIACAVVFQLSMGHGDLESSQYLMLFYYGGLPLVLTCTLAMFVQVISPNKYFGMLLSGALVLLFSRFGTAFGLEHAMFHFAQTPGLAWSAMNGYGASGVAFNWYMVYWGALASLFGLGGLAMWRRGARRLRLAASPLLVLACVLVFAGSGGYIFYQTNHIAGYESAAQQMAWRAQYEKRYRHYLDQPQPRVLAVRTTVALYPSERRFHIEGQYRLRNDSKTSITEVLVGNGRQAKALRIDLDGASSAKRDAPFGQAVFQLSEPLAPGQEATLHFALEGQRSPFLPTGGNSAISENGTVLFTLPLLPQIGYNERLELDQPNERAEQGLAPKPPLPRVEDAVTAHQGDFSDGYDWADFDTSISTEAGQRAFAPGRLEKSWTEGGRPHFHYRTAGPVRNVVGFLSGRYAVDQVLHAGVSVEIYYHPGHARNVARMRGAATASLDTFQRTFGRYPHDHLRIVEVPATTGLTGFAMPGMVLIGEQGGFLEDLRADEATDQVTRRIAHEVAHQWWGHQLDPAPIEGSLVLVETLARYAEMRVVEQTYGRPAVRRLIDFELARYLSGSARDGRPELPLYRVQDQSYLMYSKGAVAMQSLVESMGAPAVDSALRTLLASHAWPRKPATSLDLIAALKQAAPAHAALVDETFRQKVRYDLKVNSARYAKLEDGSYRLTLQLQAGKTLLDDEGRAHDMPFDQAFIIGVYDQAGDERKALYLAPHRLKTGKSEISVVIKSAPGLAAIEPELRFIERDRRDNFVEPVMNTSDMDAKGAL